MAEISLEREAMPKSSGWLPAFVVCSVLVGLAVFAAERGLLPPSWNDYFRLPYAFGHFVLALFAWLMLVDLVRFGRYLRRYDLYDVEQARSLDFMTRSVDFCLAKLDQKTYHDRRHVLQCLADGQTAFRIRWQWRHGLYTLVPLSAVLVAFSYVVWNLPPRLDLIGFSKDFRPLLVTSVEVLVLIFGAFAVRTLSDNLLSKWKILADNCVGADLVVPAQQGETPAQEPIQKESHEPLASESPVEDEDDDWGTSFGEGPDSKPKHGPNPQNARDDADSDSADEEDDRPERPPVPKQRRTPRRRPDDDDDDGGNVRGF